MSAIISPCGLYRYRLERPDPLSKQRTAVIMVNPSTADASTNDATIRKLSGFRWRNEWGTLIVGNLFAFRATDVRELATAADAVGPDNLRHLEDIFRDADRVVFAWGPAAKVPRALRGQWRIVDEMARAAGHTPLSIGEPAKDGQPRHPLMLSYVEPIVEWCAP